ncbi:MAG: hypothetical protein OQL06_07375 [Gammaproteobacteria bacterium]|nr:hypothetical protein [Gammaproteobacteria bacterium]
MKNFAMYIIVFLLGVLSGYYLAPENIVLSELNDLPESIVNGDVEHEHEIRRFMQRLAESDSTIKYLQEMNESLSSLLSGKKNEIAALLAKPSLHEKINSMSDEELLEKLLLMFKEDDLAGIENKKQMALRLTEIALGDEEIDTSMVTGTVAVTTIPEHVDYASEFLNIKQYDTLYAHLSTSDKLEKTLVKWTNLSTGKIMLFKKMAFVPEELQKYVSMRPKGGWVEGDYQVSLYNINQGLTVLASTTYTVQTVQESEPPARPDGPIIYGGDKTAVEPNNSGFGFF